MMPGKIVRSNEVLSHLGDEYFTWTTAKDAVSLIERKKKGITIKCINFVTAHSNPWIRVAKGYSIRRRNVDSRGKQEIRSG